VALFRAGHDEAFRAIYDRYHKRLFAYARQMLPGSRQDAEDALQDVFVRAYSSLRANDRELALRAWLYRVAHNRCIDELRRPAPPAPELIELVRSPVHDPIAQAEQRESLRRLIADVRRLPEHQRSALLMRELSGMTYSELAAALGVSVPAVKSLLVRARVGLVQALEARDTACSEIRDELIVAHDRGVRPNGTARRHIRDCSGCRQFRTEIRGVSRQFAALVPALGPVGLLANLLGLGGGASGSAAAGGGAAAAGGALGTGGAFAATGVLATGASHVATLLAAAVVTAGGAIEIQHTITAPVKHHSHHHAARAAGAGSVATDVVQPSRDSAVGLATSSVSLAPVVEAPAAASSDKTTPDAITRPSQTRAATKKRPAGGSTASTPSASGGSSASTGTGSGGSAATGSDGRTLGAVPAGGTTAAAPASSVSGTSSTGTGDPIAAVSPDSPATGSATGSAGQNSGQQGASSSSSGTSVTSSLGSGSSSGSSGAGGSGGSSGTSH
jgi:RNA polymerase sigma factor (sigma-70 family)